MRKSPRSFIGRRSALMVTLSLVHLFWCGRSAPAGNRADPEKVFLGNADKYNRPAQVDGDRVLSQIAAYREILDRKLTPRDPEYYVLLTRANQLFLNALRHVCRERGFDLVCRLNSLEARGQAAPDITREVVAALGKKVKPPESDPGPSVASR